MKKALDQAWLAYKYNEVPVGAVIVNSNGTIIGTGYNAMIKNLDPSGHAEIIAMKKAASIISNYRLLECTLFVTLEPCMMCIGASINARIKSIFYGTKDPKTGMIESRANLINQPWHNHCINVEGGLLAIKSKRLLKKFFKMRRKIDNY
ncbi:tRNA-specific adenosine deaminase [Candidatus Johnevansia muelleri]|uniref:tRNA-specific adenosine deaminase n=1 Tax=Candidatus Johnevansia muelleri TaxID=1495769 RepID=A0A078KHV1_9GAMM|nr:tRNA-specific adenosine deaminase [Candidatus Evansia muelleri]